MARIVIGATLSAALLAMGACSGSSPASPSSSTSAFRTQTFSATGAQPATLTTFDLGNGNEGGSAGSDGEEHGRQSQLEGAIVSIDAAHKSFVVRTTVVLVSATTVIRRGNTTLVFADLKAGDRVHVKGTPSPDGTQIAASEVTVQNEGTDDNHDTSTAEAGGVVAALAGACPSITFTLGKARIATGSTTMFHHGTCADVVNGAAVEVEGTRQTDGSILASGVSVETGDHEHDSD